MPSDRTASDLVARLGLSDVDRVTPLKPGLGGTDLWRVHRTGGDLVLRAFPTGAAPSVAEREATAHELVRGHGLAVPAVQANTVIDGRPVLLMEWADGDLLAEELWQGANATELGRRCGSTLARLHKITERPPVINARPWIAWAGDHADELTPLLQHFPADTLVHLDYHPENMIIGGDRITVLDWANVRIAPAAADLARTESILELILEAHPEMTAKARLQLRDFGGGLLDGYADAGGDPTVPGPIRAWAYAVQLHDLAGSWVPEWYFDRLRGKYHAAIGG